ncbi:MAG: DUF1501 domain-containing protein [Gemmatimonadales bacterium]|nr:DUF1501 domain-containing protein [Gemmatimonadales bacterium]
MSGDGMRDVSRRVFLRAGAAVLAGFGCEPLFLGRAAYALPAGRSLLRAGAAGRKVLVCLFQRGAVDGLSMVAPHGDPIYYAERARIAIPRERLVDLDGHFGLHPRLAALAPFWRDRSLAVVHAVGSPDATRSHFEAQDFMETATPGRRTTPDGWLNRLCQHDHEHAATPFRAVAFGPQLPKALAGSAPTLAIDDLQAFGLRAPTAATRDRLTRVFEALYEQSATGLVASSAEEGFHAVEMLRRVNPAQYAPRHGAEYPRGRLGRALRQVAQLIRADVGLSIACVEAGGWDTHIQQGAAEGQLANRLGELGDALAAFAADLGDGMADVVVLTMSEFGRTVRQNGTQGTDHGHGTAMLVLGGGVRGGQVAGRWPGLDPAARHDGRDLAITTDFRDLFGEVAQRHLGVHDLAPLFPGYASSATRFPGVLG